MLRPSTATRTPGLSVVSWDGSGVALPSDKSDEAMQGTGVALTL